MIKDTRYIIKRVVIGVLISLVLSLIYSCEVKAEGTQGIELESYNLAYDVQNTNTGRAIFQNSNGIFKNWNRSTLIFSIAVWHYSATASIDTPVLYNIEARTANSSFTCNFGNNSLVYDSTGDDMIANIFNVVCDMNMDSTGLREIAVNFKTNGSAFRVSTSEKMTAYKNIDDRTYSQMLLLNSQINSQNGKIDAIYGSVDQLEGIIDTLNGRVLQIYGAVDQVEGFVNALTQQTMANTNAIINAITNGNAQIIQKQEETTSAVNDVNDSINNDNVDDPSNSLTSMDNQIATNSVISDLLLLPITLFQNVLNSINGTCSTFNLGSLLGTNLTLPCINLSNILGSALYGVIDILLCGIFVLSMRKKFVNIFENITSLKDRGNELE